MLRQLNKMNVILLLIVMILTMTACGSSESMMDSISTNTNGGYKGDMGFAEDRYYEDAVQEEFAPEVLPDKEVSSEINSYSQKLIKTYNFTFETTDYNKSITFINSKVKEYNGYIESSETHGKNYRNSNITIRIPDDKIDLFLNETGNIGEVIYSSESAEDITLQYYDLASKIETLEVQHDRILEILKKAETLEDVITLEQRLSEIQYELNSYNSKIKVYDNLVNYVTVHININEVSQIQVVEEDSFFDEIKKGLASNIADIIEAFTSLLIWLITGIPYFLIIGIVIFVITRILKMIKKKLFNKKVEEPQKETKKNE